jgi:hypothetical protein
MTWNDVRKRAIKEYYPGFFLENLWPRGRGIVLLKSVRILWSVLVVLGVLVYGLSKTSSPMLSMYVPKIFGAFSLAFGFWMAAGAIHAFFNWYYYKSMPAAEGEKPVMSFELGRILYRTKPEDILGGFLESDEGFEIMMRTGIDREDIRGFLAHRQFFINPDALSISDEGYTSASDYATSIFDADKDFAQLLFAYGIQKKDFQAITEWVFEREIAKRAQTRWWSRSHLARIPGIGKNWSYGQIYNLEQF